MNLTDRRSTQRRVDPRLGGCSQPGHRQRTSVVGVAAICAALSLWSLSVTWSPVLPRAGAASNTVVPASSTQLIVGIVDGWNGRDVVLRRFSRKPGKASKASKASKAWKSDGAPWVGRLGANGVAWGRGLHPHDPIPAGAVDKQEGDRRAPAGVFRLGTVFGYPEQVPHRSATTYVHVTDRDLLVEDPNSPLYNSYVRLDHPATSSWEIANRMTMGDPAHELKVFVHHNTDPSPVSGKGSAILLHISRPSERSYTSGCTAMTRERMYETVAWLDAARNPLYVLLPQSEYNRLAGAWGLPASLVTASLVTATDDSLERPSSTARPAAPSTLSNAARRVAAAGDTTDSVPTPRTTKTARIPVSVAPTIPVATARRARSVRPTTAAKHRT